MFMDPEFEEESLFEEVQERQLERMLRGHQKNMYCPVCNVENKNGTRFHNVNALLQHSRSIQSRDPADKLGHRQQAGYIAKFLSREHKQDGKDGTGSRNNRSSNLNTANGSSRNGNGGSNSSLGTTEEQIFRENFQRGSVKLRAGMRREREQDTADWGFVEDEELGMDVSEDRVDKLVKSDRAFPKDAEFEVWPPVIIIQGIQATYKIQDSKWWPVEINNDKLSGIICDQLGFGIDDFKTAPKVLYGSQGVSVDNEAGILSIGDKKFSLGTGFVQLKEKAFYKLVNFHMKISTGQKCRQGWEQFRKKWGALCSQATADYLPKQQSTLFAYQANPADVELLLSKQSSVKSSIVALDECRGDPDRLVKKLEEGVRKQREIQMLKHNLASNLENRIQEKQKECIDLKQVVEQRTKEKEEKQQIFEEQKLLVEQIQGENDALKQQIQVEQQQIEQRTKMFQMRIAEMQRQENSAISTYEVQVGHLTSKLQCLQLESKQQIKQKQHYERLQIELQRKELELQMVKQQEQQLLLDMKEKEQQNTEMMMEIELITRDLQELQVEDQDEENQKMQEMKTIEIEEKLKAMGFNFKLEDIRNYELTCQICCEDIIEYKIEPDWWKIEECRFDQLERRRQMKEWKEKVRSRFYVRLDCKYGCSGFCLGCSEKLWVDQQKKARKENRKTVICPYCKNPWKSRPEPHCFQLKGFQQ